ncbi:MAG: ABC transporter ATP-binding protein [Angelakisella sp.]|nr:ABC transporter ATP-binding protein [Angelakisella sp.]
MEQNLLEIKNLHVHYVTDTEDVQAVNGVNLRLKQGEVLGLVGETGAGKTTVALSVMQLVPDPPGIILDGEILFKGRNLIYNTKKENQEMRGNGISMIFQDPMTALNPIMTIGQQLAEVVIKHKKLGKKEALEVAAEMLEKVGVTRDRLNDYPHQFSGGMKQRAIIAMALLCNPEILIADEPTTALDVTIQAQVLEIIRNLVREQDMSMILITHDLGVVAETCDYVAIMYAGEVVEYGTVWDVYTDPKHPYTRGLFDSIPKMDGEEERLSPIPGLAPNSTALPSGCYFHPRCKFCQDRCREQSPEMKGTEHQYKCWLDLE